MKKSLIILTLLISLVFISSFALAELKIEKTTGVDTVITDIRNPATFNLKITNLGEDDVFRIYTLVGIRVEPADSFALKQGETKDIAINVIPEEGLLKNYGTFNFVYKVEGVKSGIQEETMSIRILRIKDAIDLGTYTITFDSEQAKLYVNNRGGFKFDEIKADFDSAFFSFSKTFSLDKYQKQEFDVQLNKEETKKLTAGQYTLTAKVSTLGLQETFNNYFKFSEKAEIITEESKSGIIISKTSVKKTNQGNLPFVVQAKITKNIISRLFTTFNYEPVTVERTGLRVEYTFQKEIAPAEEYLVIARTNWLYPLLIVIAIFIIVMLIKNFTTTHIILRKKTTFVKTKGGEFALKVSIIVKAKSYIERIKVVDKIPGLVKLYDRFGLVSPSKVDEKNRRIEWDIEALQSGEERVFSYIIFSKVGVVGRFELPTATALYEKDGKLKETNSNKVFFITEPRKIHKNDVY